MSRRWRRSWWTRDSLVHRGPESLTVDALVSCNSDSRHKRSGTVGLEGALSEAGDAGEDLVGGLDPDVGFSGVVVNIDELLDGGDELGHAAMHAATELFGGECRKPSLNQVDPRGIGRGEMEVEARMTGEPATNEGTLMRAGIVENDVDVESSWHVGVDVAQERAELACALPRKGLAEHFARTHVQRGVQGRGAVTLVVIGCAAPLAPAVVAVAEPYDPAPESAV